MTLASVTGLGVSFDDHPALRDVSLDIAPAASVAVLGAAGAGKSTLTRAVVGLIPDLTPATVTGEITRPVALAYVPEDAAAALVEPKVADDVAYGLPEDRRDAAVAEALRTVGLAELGQRPTGELSGGQVQRVAIAGALARGAELLVLDDPTSELDAEGRESVLEALSGQACLVATHDPVVAARADLAVVLDGGAVAYCGSPAELYQDPQRCRALGLRTPARTGLRQRLGLSAAPEPGGVVATVQDLTFAYPSGPMVLQRVNLEVRAGEVVALRGANGSGKSTLARCLAGLLAVEDGAVAVEGRVAMVFQNPDAQLFESTVRAEVGFAARCQGVGAEEERARVDAALTAVGLATSDQVHPMQLPRSSRQLVAVASALAARPDLIILDEPTAGLDAFAFDAVATAIADASAAGTAVVLVTHDDELASLATRTVTLAAQPLSEGAHQPPTPDSAQRRHDPRVVGLVLAAAMIIAIVAPSWPVLTGLLVAGLITVLATLDRPVSRLKTALLPLLPIAALMGLFGYLWPPPGVASAVSYAATLMLRLPAMVTWTLWALARLDSERAIKLARQSRLPRSMVLVVTIAMRFIPTLQKRLAQIRVAQQSRGARLDGGITERARGLISVLIPLFVGALRTANDLAAALTVRGIVGSGSGGEAYVGAEAKRAGR